MFDDEDDGERMEAVGRLTAAAVQCSAAPCYLDALAREILKRYPPRCVTYGNLEGGGWAIGTIPPQPITHDDDHRGQLDRLLARLEDKEILALIEAIEELNAGPAAVAGRIGHDGRIGA